MGKVIGAIFVAEIGDISRFDSPKKLCCWAGLTPKHRESDEVVHRGPITKQGSALVRWAAIEAVAKYRARAREAPGRLPPDRGAPRQVQGPSGGGPQAAHPRVLRAAGRRIRCLETAEAAA